MGEMAGYKEGEMFDVDKMLEITRDTCWQTQTGVHIAIKYMDDKHLLNTIRVLRKLSPIGTKVKLPPAERRQWVNAMANEAYRRGLRLDDLTETEPVHE